jgi:hypothetical protein
VRDWRGGKSFYNRIIGNAGFDGIAPTRSG